MKPLAIAFLALLAVAEANKPSVPFWKDDTLYTECIDIKLQTHKTGDGEYDNKYVVEGKCLSSAGDYTVTATVDVTPCLFNLRGMMRWGKKGSKYMPPPP